MSDYFEFYCPRCQRYTKAKSRFVVPGEDLWCGYCQNVYVIEYRIVFDADAAEHRIMGCLECGQKVGDKHLKSCSHAKPPRQ